MSKSISEASAKRSVTATTASPALAHSEHLALLGGDVDLFDRLGTGPVCDLEQPSGILAPAIEPPAGRQYGPSGVEDRSAAQVG